MSQHLTKKQFAQYMENGKAKFYRLAFCYVKNEHDALEIISEATYRGFIHLNKLEKPEFFDTWMSRIIINCAYDLLKKQKNMNLSFPTTAFPNRRMQFPLTSASIYIRR